MRRRAARALAFALALSWLWGGARGRAAAGPGTVGEHAAAVRTEAGDATAASAAGRREATSRSARAEGEGGADEAAAVVRLEEAARRRAGIELAVAPAAARAPEVDGYGRVLDPSPVVEAVARRAAARAAREAARREARRVEALQRDDQNASMRDVEAARAALARAEADLEVARARVVSLLGPKAAGDAGLPSLAGRLAGRRAALVRIDVPAGAAAPHPERGARLRAFPDREGSELRARLLGPAPDANPMLPGWGFLFLVTEAPPPPGTPVRARLRATGDEISGVTVPASAVLRRGGALVAFVRRGPGVYERRRVVAREGERGLAFVSKGIRPGETVVAAGAEALLSAGLLGPAGGEASDEDPGEP